MTPRPPPLESELDELLDAERYAPVPPRALARVWSRLATVPSPLGPNAGEVAPRRPLRFPSIPHVLKIGLAAFAAGAAAGAFLHSLLRPSPPPRVVFVDRPAAPGAVSNPLAAVGAGSTVSVPGPAPIAATPVAPTRAAPLAEATGPRVETAHRSVSSLSEERAMLDEARAALARSDGATALALTDEYTRRFARPQLGEECEAIAIQALVFTGRYAEARTRAARFEAGAPSSLFRPAVETAVGSIPDTRTLLLRTGPDPTH